MSESGSAMEGDRRARRYQTSKLMASNISELTKDEVRTLLASSADSVCTRLYQRRDGTVIVKDCPLPWPHSEGNLLSVLASWLLCSLPGSSPQAPFTGPGKEGFGYGLHSDSRLTRS